MYTSAMRSHFGPSGFNLVWVVESALLLFGIARLSEPQLRAWEDSPDGHVDGSSPTAPDAI